MNIIQFKILELSKRKSLKSITLREICKEIGIKESPQQVKHHITQLLKKGFLDSEWRSIKLKSNNGGVEFINLPIMGYCY
jgi:predicted transcriptional regulator